MRPALYILISFPPMGQEGAPNGAQIQACLTFGQVNPSPGLSFPICGMETVIPVPWELPSKGPVKTLESNSIVPWV